MINFNIMNLILDKMVYDNWYNKMKNLNAEFRSKFIVLIDKEKEWDSLCIDETYNEYYVMSGLRLVIPLKKCYCGRTVHVYFNSRNIGDTTEINERYCYHEHTFGIKVYPLPKNYW